MEFVRCNKTTIDLDYAHYPPIGRLATDSHMLYFCSNNSVLRHLHDRIRLQQALFWVNFSAQ